MILATARIDARHAKAADAPGRGTRRVPGNSDSETVASARLRILATGHPGVRAGRFGIAVAFAVATVAAPIVGVDGLFTPLSPAQAAVTAPRASDVLEAVAFRAVPAEAPVSREVPNEFKGAGVPTTDADLTAAREQALAVGAAQSHAAVPGCTGDVVNSDAVNGKIEIDDLCVLPWTPQASRLRGDAALAIGRLNAEYFQAFGQDLCVNDAYRSYEAQVAVRAAKPGLAAPAGVSNHGWALALDLCGGVQDDASPQWAWMVQNAPKYGWDNPAWARAGGRGPHEPWHWEFVSAVAEQRAKMGLHADNGAESAAKNRSKREGIPNKSASAKRSGSSKPGSSKKQSSTSSQRTSSLRN